MTMKEDQRVPRKRHGRYGEERPVQRAKLRTAHLSAEHLQLVTEHEDLDVLGAFASPSCERASQRAGDEGEDEEHLRMLGSGWSEGESEFPTPTGLIHEYEPVAA